ncbi:conserved hypothetical protein [Talaromyces stipitatus ATCC 10500]|uniref:Tachykinin family protein n=1 Tax=Talaromyces stipitatus (strain ATCC 10500 / CBS 375.48 / QM 6759 / NRRL 1006) TaxID=441959 RepID=B8LXE7_TALSN|nr:uncharacterized protein TSTA_066740 [Talaromyces stipitatus ATCC 10500]EED23228.1 conserved hypothetical protein [Talaromyces stipitatus ATCC 10500]
MLCSPSSPSMSSSSQSIRLSHSPPFFGFSDVAPTTSSTTDFRANSQATFLFVDSYQDQAKNAAIKTQKQAFLAKNYHRKKKQASIQRLKSSNAVPKDHLHIGYKLANDRPTSDTNLSTPSTGKNGKSDLRRKPDSPPGRQVAMGSEIWSLNAYLGQGCVDPFSSSAVKMTDLMNQYFHHFRIHTVVACYPLEWKRMSIWWWQKANTTPALLQTLLFSTAGHLAASQINSGMAPHLIQKSIHDCLHLKGVTLKTLNDIMQDPVKAVAGSTTLVVASLVAIEACSASFEALEAHTKGLRRLIHLRGGLDTLDHMTISKIYQLNSISHRRSDVKSAALKNTQPMFPISARWRSEILQDSKVFLSKEDLETPENLLSLGVNFFHSPWYGELDSNMKTFIRALRRLILYYEVAQVRPSIVIPTDNDLFLVFEHELLSAKYCAEADDVHESLRLTLMIYVNLRIFHFQKFPIMEHMAQTLKQSLELQYSYLESTAPELLFWILFIGSMASHGYKSHYWFVNGLTEMTRRLGLGEWDKARSALRGFFYTDQLTEREAEENLWNEVLSADYAYIAPRRSIDNK